MEPNQKDLVPGMAQESRHYDQISELATGCWSTMNHWWQVEHRYHKKTTQFFKILCVFYWERVCGVQQKSIHCSQCRTICTWDLMAISDTSKRDNERLRVINLQFKAKSESQKTFRGACKYVLISCSSNAEKTEDQSQDLNITVAESQVETSKDYILYLCGYDISQLGPWLGKSGTLTQDGIFRLIYLKDLRTLNSLQPAEPAKELHSSLSQPSDPSL